MKKCVRCGKRIFSKSIMSCKGPMHKICWLNMLLEMKDEQILKLSQELNNPEKARLAAIVSAICAKKNKAAKQLFVSKEIFDNFLKMDEYLNIVEHKGKFSYIAGNKIMTRKMSGWYLK